MPRIFLKRLVIASPLFLFLCLSIYLFLHNRLVHRPNVDAAVLAMYNHDTRRPKPSTTPRPRPQIHVKTLSPPMVHINMTMRQIEYQFFKFLEDKSIRCENDIRLGNLNDGGWNVCLSPPYFLQQPCIVFSFGIGYDWQFDDSVSKIYGCRVLAFDPSMPEPDSRRSPLIEFRKIGLGPRNEIRDGWRMKTLGTHLKDEGYWGVPVDYVKIDIEYDEWDVLKTAFNEGALKFVKQLGFELHSKHFLISTRKIKENKNEKLETQQMAEKVEFVHMYQTIRQLEILNFRKFNYRKNPFGNYVSNFTKKEHSCCYELHYINTDFLSGNDSVIHIKDSKLFH